MIVKVIEVDSENLFSMLYNIGIERVEMIVPKVINGNINFEVYYKEKI